MNTAHRHPAHFPAASRHEDRPTIGRRVFSFRGLLVNPLRVLAALIAALALLVPKSAADTLTFQQGVGGYAGLKQTTLFQLGAGASAVNGGLAAGTWTVDGGSASYNDGQFKQGLIWFDNIFGSNPGQIPLGSTITSATITATYDDISTSAFSTYRMLQTWSPATATWNSFANGVQNDGVEAAAAASASVSNPNGNVSGTYNAWGTSLTADLQLFSNGTPNYGWVVLPTSGNAGWGWSAAQTNSPVLSVTFTPPASTLAATITSPASSATVGQSFTITAAATAVFPATVASVTFKDGATTLGVDTTSPYSWDVTGAAPGSHTLTAVITDSNSATATSSPVNVTVVNAPPTVSVTSPTGGSSFTVGSNVTLNATAADDVAVTSVEFFVDNVSIGTDNTSPYSAAWNNVPPGAHVLKAVATDGTNSTTSTLVNVSVSGFGALQFDGVDDYVTMGNNGATPSVPTSQPLGAQSFTLECWVKHDPSGTGRTTASSGSGGVNIYPLIGKGRGEADGSNVDCNYTFGLQTDGRLAADFEDLNSGLNHPIIGTNVVPSNTWHHVAATYDATTGIWKLYIDGVQDTTVTVSGSGNVLIPRYDSVQHFGLGTAMNSAGATQGFFKGVMDEVRVWNVARTQAEIQSTMNSEVVSATGLIGRWSLNESSGTAAINSGSAGTGVNGTLTGANGLPTRATGYPFGPQAPTVAITSPANNATVGTIFTIDATAADSDGTITSVSFYDGATLLGTDTTSPYSYSWVGASVGSHALTAVAVDNSSLSTTSATVNVTVTSNNPPTITLASPANLATVPGTSTTISASVIDPEAGAMTVTFYGRQTAPVTPGPDFTVIAIPDTQFYSEDAGRNPVAPGTGAHISYFTDQTNWITANRISRNISFVAHMGDMVQNADSVDAEWVRADGAMQLIENPLTTLLTNGIPWGGAPGNHDIGVAGALGTGSTVKWNQYFGSGRWAGRAYFGGHYGTDNNNNYQFFRAAGLDFLVINISYGTTADTAVHDWADALMKAYPNHRVILTSHWIINTGNPATFGGQGQALYDNLKDNPNLFLMLCGHVHGDGRRTDVFQGRTIYSILSDFQDGANGGNGFLRTLTFSPANNRITAEMYSPTLGRTATVADVPTSQGIYNLDYNLQGAVSDWIPLGTVNVPANGTTASINWTGLQAGRDYEWYATTNDGIYTVTSATRRFRAADGSVPTVAITSPANNSTYFAPFTANLTATASDPDGSVTKVEFFDGATKLGEDTTAPYQYTATGLGLGSHPLTAVATDNLGNTTTSAVVTVTANALDSDGDGIPDSYETAHGLNPANPVDAALDSDGDGVSNRDEFIFGTASDVADRYAFSAAYNSPAGTATVTFATSTGRTYRVFYSNTLGAGSWQPGSGVVPGTGATMQWTDDGTVTGSLPSVAEKRYYRIEATVVP